MNPKKAKDYVSELAKELQLSEELISDIVDFAFSGTKKKMSSLKYLQVGIPGLGIFRVSYKKLKIFAKKNRRKKISDKSFKSRKYKEDLEEKMKAVNYCLDKWVDEYKRLQEHKQRKDEYKKGLRAKKTNP